MCAPTPKKILAALALSLCMALGGCTKQSQLMVLNTSGAEISIRMVSSEETEGESGPWSSGEWTVQNDKWVDGLYWSRRPPDWIKATVTSVTGPLEKTWHFEEYPIAMQDASGFFDFYIVEVTPEGIVLRKPTFREHLDYNPAAYLLMLLCLLAGIALAIRYHRRASKGH
jgi:hypothetical protein